MMKAKIENTLNKQINAELYSAYLYLSMSAYFESINLSGFAHWMRVQAKEEVGHAMRIYDHVVERLGRVNLSGIANPPASWKSPLNAFEDAYKHEQKVTRMIHDLVDLARQEKDHATESMLQWFIDEQVEEENQTDVIVQKLRLIKDNTNGLFMLDHELGKRKEE
ncbi:MAG: ferritin [Candidatus Thermoplasmatota archaeon]